MHDLHPDCKRAYNVSNVHHTRFTYDTRVTSLDHISIDDDERDRCRLIIAGSTNYILVMPARLVHSDRCIHSCLLRCAFGKGQRSLMLYATHSLLSLSMPRARSQRLHRAGDPWAHLLDGLLLCARNHHLTAAPSQDRQHSLRNFVVLCVCHSLSFKLECATLY